MLAYSDDILRLFNGGTRHLFSSLLFHLLFQILLQENNAIYPTIQHFTTRWILNLQMETPMPAAQIHQSI